MKSKEQHVDASQISKTDKNTKLNNKISESFQQLRKNEKLSRINGAITLLQQIKELKGDENEVNNSIFKTKRSIILSNLVKFVFR